ncbi:hypothetical protein [Roseisolibacter agri]|uniref:Outer membrane protein beta-barrel domain-containing protein n=1 Tax=Roseisolibacter agri TaxID=2014610 RepID=A0AA37QM57_9BACT|nr:hypothetical protein [Roseisolibacter agri]GLC28388.1 hypothetical protein rosag_49010 [Roseisolibacter agri]
MSITHIVRGAPALIAAVLALAPGATHAQDAAPRPTRRSAWSIVRPLLEGAASGTGLAAAYISSGGEGWLVSDATAFNAALAAGIGGALGVWAGSGGLAADAPDRPRLRVAAGLASGADHDVSLAIRVPVRGRLSLEAAALVRNATSERFAEETRCGGFFGCVTATYLVDHRYEQSIAGLVRAAYRLPAMGAVTPVLSAGGGPMVTHVDREGVPAARHDGMLMDVGLALELGRVSRWTIEADARGPVRRGLDAARTGPELSLRLGRAFGYR